jgi:hypothetical protein
MPTGLRILLFLAFVGMIVPGPAVADEPAAEDPQAVVEKNRRKLDKWRADPDHYARLSRDYQAFLALPAEQQERLRQFDRDFHGEDPTARARLWTVLERYVAWLDQLPDADRAWIEASPDTKTRLARVQSIRDQQWVTRLPRKEQEELAKLSPDKRAAKIAELRRNERQRRLDWFWFSHERDAGALKRARPTRIQEFPPEVRLYFFASISRALSDADRKRLANAEGNWPLYARTLAQIMDRPSPVLPGFYEFGKFWPKRFAELPRDWKLALDPFRPQAKLGSGLGKGQAAELKKQQELKRRLFSRIGKWPEYAITATQIVRELKLSVSSQLGPAKIDDFAPTTKAAIQTDLLPKLSEAEAQDLTASEGKWPDYPQRLLELAKRHGVPLAGLVRPCPPEFWDAMSKLLPDVPDRALRNFALTELTPEERTNLKLSPDDIGSRERLVEKYWASHPDELDSQLRPRRGRRP